MDTYRFDPSRMQSRQAPYQQLAQCDGACLHRPAYSPGLKAFRHNVDSSSCLYQQALWV
jgi:hypothetical protein